MATRKQKHQAALERRELRLAAERAVGLKALDNSRRIRQQEELREWEDNHKKNHNSEDKMIKECPHCRILLSTN